MYRIIVIFLFLLLGMTPNFGCNKKNSLVRGDGSESKRTIRIQLPNRSSLEGEVANIETLMDGYKLTASPGGTNASECITGNETAEWANQVTMVVSVKCDYNVILYLGTLGTTGAGNEGLALSTEEPNFDDDIKPLNDRLGCANGGCHDGTQVPFTNYAEIQVDQANYVSRVVDGSMPPGGGIDAADIALLETWRSNGYPKAALVEDPEGGEPEAGGTGIALVETFYKNKPYIIVAEDPSVKGYAVLNIDLQLELQLEGSKQGLQTKVLQQNVVDDSDGYIISNDEEE